MSLEFLISKIQKNNFLLIGRAGVDIYPDPPGTKTENANKYVTHLGGSSANMGVQLTKNDIVNSNLQNYECILITGTSLAAEPSRSAVLYALKLAKEKKIPVIMDIDYRPYTWESEDKAKEIYNLAGDYCSGIIGNDDEFAILSGNYDDGLSYAKKISRNCDLVIYKMGEKGSITFANNEEIQRGIFPVKPLKPTGAGDAFMGSLIGAILKNYDLQKAIEIGSAAAAIVVTKVGCAPAMPDLDEVLDFMKNNNINKGER